MTLMLSKYQAFALDNFCQHNSRCLS